MDEAAKEPVGEGNVFPKCMRDSDFKTYHQRTPEAAKVPIETNLCRGCINDAGTDRQLLPEEVPVLAAQLGWNKAKLIKEIPALWELLVQSLMTQLEQLEENIPEYSEVHLRDHLLAHLRPEIHQEVLAHQEPPLTQLELIALAIRAEEIIQSNKKRWVLNHQSNNKEQVSSKLFDYHKGKPPVKSSNVMASVTLSPSWNSGGNPHHPDKELTGD
ncbi:hypothetical protein MMC09_001285 [Bachmanniomyces sp. S44760]|nr:hypothetical protein [Bachmanniomyces sp. S44760]